MDTRQHAMRILDVSSIVFSVLSLSIVFMFLPKLLSVMRHGANIIQLSFGVNYQQNNIV